MRLQRVLPLISVSLFLVGSRAVRDDTGEVAHAQERAGGEKLIIARNHTHAFHLLAAVVAQEKKFFEGVTVEIYREDLMPEFESGDELRAKMQSAGIDIVVDAKTKAVLRQNPSEPGLVIIGGWIEGANALSKILARKEIDSLQKLRGKRVATSGRDSENAAALEFLLHREGLHPDRDVVWVPGLSRNTRAAQALRTDKVDAAIVSPNDARDLQREGYRILLDYEKVYGPEGRPERAIVATRDVVRRSPQAIKAFVKGMLRAYRLMGDWQRNEAFLEPVWKRVVAAAKDDLGEDYKDSRMAQDGMVPVQALRKMLAEDVELGHSRPGLRLESVVDLQWMQQAAEELERSHISY